jgi:uncharacterized protein YecE (DUF72 family)
MSGVIRYGTSSFSSKDWVGPFYSRDTRPEDYLREYSNIFDTVEIDATYYSIPSVDAVKGWVDKTDANFLLSAKFPRSIVHAGEKALPNPEAILEPDFTYPIRDRFLRTMEHAKDRLGTLILQFPYFSRKVFPSKLKFMAKLDTFLGDLPGGFNYGVEIRNKQWLDNAYSTLLKGHNVTMVVIDHAWMPHPDELADRMELVTSDTAYVRLIGDRKEIESITKSWDREVIDRSDRLNRWADYLVTLVDLNIRILVYINNHFAGHAPATLRRLKAMVDERIGE